MTDLISKHNCNRKTMVISDNPTRWVAGDTRWYCCHCGNVGYVDNHGVPVPDGNDASVKR